MNRVGAERYPVRAASHSSSFHKLAARPVTGLKFVEAIVEGWVRAFSSEVATGSR
jgi:hypothetical protein